jgi:glycosyltransferase involved in cell wall biosynthesis
MTSVVIAAHNEEAVIGECLDALLDQAPPGQLDITVACNGCTDATGSAAERRGVRVLTLATRSKAAALNAADVVAVGFPRIYVDADIVLRRGAIQPLVEALCAPGTVSPPLAVVPRRVLDLRHRPLLVQAYYAINARHPAYRTGLFGRGVIGVSEAGRARFESFPEMIADDLFLDARFAPAEKREVYDAVARVATPRRTRDLLRRLIRVRAGNRAMRDAHPEVRRSARWSWLRDVVLPRPWLAPAAACYVALTVAAGLRARRSARRPAAEWGRDESSRTPTPTGGRTG